MVTMLGIGQILLLISLGCVINCWVILDNMVPIFMMEHLGLDIANKIGDWYMGNNMSFMRISNMKSVQSVVNEVHMRYIEGRLFYLFD